MRHFLYMMATMAAILGAGCQSAPEKHYPLQAEVISVDAPRNLMVVKHGEIPGLMPAMTMQYVVADGKQIEKLKPGDKISTDLVVSESKSRLEKIVLLDEAKPAANSPAEGGKTP